MRPYSSDPFRDNQRAASQSLSHLVKDGGQKMPSQFGTKPTLANTGLDIAMRAMAIRQAQQEQDQARQVLERQERMRRVELHTKLLHLQRPPSLTTGGARPAITASRSTPVFSIVKKHDVLYYDYLIRSNGQIVRKSSNSKSERYYIEVSSRVVGNGKILSRQYKLIATLPVNEYGLVSFPDTNTKLEYDRYGGIQPSGKQSGVKNGKPFIEDVGEGDHYLKPDVAAALFGVLNDMCQRGLKLSLGDMSASNGSDPGVIGFHHSGHGHMGNRSGLDIDFRYIGQSGKSFQGSMVDGTERFSKKFNQALYESAYKYGFDKAATYQGLSNLLTGVKKMDSHNDHGHLGFSKSPTNVIDYEPYPAK